MCTILEHGQHHPIGSLRESSVKSFYSPVGGQLPVSVPPCKQISFLSTVATGHLPTDVRHGLFNLANEVLFQGMSLPFQNYFVFLHSIIYSYIIREGYVN